jgi:hypothetical protein
MRRLSGLIVALLLLINASGCAAVIAGAAGGAGTAGWLSGKLTQQYDVPYEKAIKAAKTALRSLKLEIVKETKEQRIAQLRSKYYDGENIWIDIRKVTDKSSKVEVRVGLIDSDKEAADKILKRINKYISRF